MERGGALEPASQMDRVDARAEARACCALCGVKEFLICSTLFLVCVDLFDFYANIIRTTGTDLLPFPGNHSELYYTNVPEMSYYDMIVSAVELASVVVLSLSVCGNSIDGIACGACGFASGMVLEFVYTLWLCVAVAWDSTDEGLDPPEVLYALLYTVVPYGGLLLIRAYTLVQVQAFRRSLVREKRFRERAKETSTLLARP